MSPWIPYAFFTAAVALCLLALIIGVLSGKDGFAAAGALAAVLVIAAPIFIGWVA